MWSKPDKQGELRKQGHVVKNWKTRWFIIQHDMMFYFKQKGVSDQLSIIQDILKFQTVTNQLSI